MVQVVPLQYPTPNKYGKKNPLEIRNFSSRMKYRGIVIEIRSDDAHSTVVSCKLISPFSPSSLGLFANFFRLKGPSLSLFPALPSAFRKGEGIPTTTRRGTALKFVGKKERKKKTLYFGERGKVPCYPFRYCRKE